MLFLPLIRVINNLIMRAKRLSIPEDRVDLTPMIDIVFLLLIYFMVTTTIVKEEAD